MTSINRIILFIIIFCFVTLKILPQGKPELLSPGRPYKPGKELNQGDLVFKWTNVDGAKGYRIYISRKNKRKNYVVIYSSEKKGLIKETTFDARKIQLKENNNYSWGVRALIGNDWSPPSRSLYFILKSNSETKTKTELPSTPQIVSPGNTQEPGVLIKSAEMILKWKRLAQAKSYAVYLSQKNNKGNFSLIYNSSDNKLITDTFFTVPKGLIKPNKFYRWNIRAFNNLGWSKFSKINYFHTSSTLTFTASPKILFPLSPGSTTKPFRVVNTLRPTFRWNKIPTAKSYFISLSILNKKGGYEKIFDSKKQKIVDTTFVIPTNILKENESYRWTVSSISKKDSVSTSKTYLFFSVKLNEPQEEKLIIPTTEQISSDAEEIYVTLQYAGLINQTIVAYYRNNKIFLPLVELFNALEINIKTDYKLQEVTGIYLGQDKSYKLDLKKMEITFGGKNILIDKEEFLKTDFGFNFSPEFYKKVFDINLNFQFSNLTVHIDGSNKTPLSERILREKSYNFLLAKKEEKNYKLIEKKKSIFSIGFFDYQLSNVVSKQNKPNGLYSLGLGAELLGGDIQASTLGNYSDGNIYDTQNRFLWRYVFSKNNLITSASLGNLALDAIIPTEFFGGQITNNPVEPRTQFSSYKIFDKTQPNWTVEIYIDNILVDHVKADATGNFSFNVPLNYGNLTVQLKYYGTGGEFYTENKLIQIPFYMLRPDEFVYSINAGKQSLTNNNLTSLSLGYGISKWLTTKFEMEYLESTNENKPIIYNSTTLNIGGNNLLNFTIAPDALYKISANTTFYSQTSIDLGYTKFVKKGIFNLLNNNHEFYGRFFLPLSLDAFRLNLQTNYSYLESEISKTHYLIFGANAIFSNFSAGINYNYSKNYFNTVERNNSSLDIGVSFHLAELSSLFRILEGNFITMQSSYSLDEKKLENLNVSFSSNITERVRLQFSHTQNFLNEVSNSQIQFVFNLPFSTVSALANNDVYAQSLTGSIIYNNNLNSLGFQGKPQIGRAIATFKMFIDENGNDRMDSKEKLVEGASLEIGNSIVHSQNDGLLTIYDLNPYVKYNVSVLEEKLKNPLLVPKIKNFSISNSPNSIQLIEIPFYVGGEVSGYVFKYVDTLKTAVSGIKIHLTHVVSNKSYVTNTYSDGSYYLSGILPGSYEMNVDKEQSDFLNLVSSPEKLFFSIEFSKEGDIIENMNFILKNR